MCTVCGCGEGETTLQGEAHRHADGTVHSHGHACGEHHPQPGQGAWSYRPRRDEAAHVHTGGEASDLHYGHGPAGAHTPGMSQSRMVQIEQDILSKNNRYAAINRRRFADHGIFCINLVSSPGSGKTTLLVDSIRRLTGRLPVAVIEGDQQTSVDAERVRATGVPAIQINTGKGCHLDAHMVGHALDRLPLQDASALLIENVGNLVCPSEFDLGEACKVVILSVTEGEDKPLKYPNMFRAASLMLLTKTDLLPHLDFDVARCLEHARRVNPGIEIMQLSARTGAGMQEWLDWIARGVEAARASHEQCVAALRKRVAELEAQLRERRG